MWSRDQQRSLRVFIIFIKVKILTAFLKVSGLYKRWEAFFTAWWMSVKDISKIFIHENWWEVSSSCHQGKICNVFIWILLMLLTQDCNKRTYATYLSMIKCTLLKGFHFRFLHERPLVLVLHIAPQEYQKTVQATVLDETFFFVIPCP